MSIEKSPFEKAKQIARQAIVPPLRVVYDDGFQYIEPALREIRGVGNAQNWLDETINQGLTMSVEPGIKAKIIYWDGEDGVVAGFNRDGIQVAYGHAHWNMDPNHREKLSHLMSYDTAYIVGRNWEGSGIATAMMNLLETHVATNNQGLGAGFFYTIQAETETGRVAAKKMIDRIGAKSTKVENFYMRLALKPRIPNAVSGPGFTILPSEAIPNDVSY